VKKMSLHPLLNLSDDAFYNILLFLEEHTYMSRVLCKQIAPLCSESRNYVGNDSSLWETILGGYYLNGSGSSTVKAYRARTQRRSSKRLRRTTAREDVIHAHFVIRDSTEMALQEVADMAISKIPKPLSLARLRGVLTNYGPILHINQRSAHGGTFLVDCCRARCVKESVILVCVKELIVKYGASPDVPATEGASYKHLKKKNHNTLPPLVIAASRGMHTIVKYLLKNSSVSITEKGTSRFRLFMNPKKSICGTYTPLEFAEKMKEAEIENGATECQLPSLNACIKLLKDASEISIF